MNQNPHTGMPVMMMGEPLENAQAVMIMIHGRGATPMDILSLASEFRSQGFAYLAPQAANNTWYPYPFNVPSANNEPWLTSALNAVDQTIGKTKEHEIPAENIILLGFSQGACLALEYAARFPRRYGGVVGLSGGLIGAGDEIRQAHGDLAGTPVFLGCSDVDPHIPLQRVHKAAAVLKSIGAQVETRIYPGMDHTVNEDELSVVQSMMAKLAGG